MTAPAAAPSVREDIISAIVDLALEDDIVGVIEAARGMLRPAAFRELCAGLEACPIHIEPLDMCADEGRGDCQHLYRDLYGRG